MIPAITRIMMWSIFFCCIMVALVNLFPATFFGLFGQGAEFVKEGIPVLRVVTGGLVFMSVANIWLNGVTGTGKTKMNLAIEIIAITVYMVYTWYFMKVNYVSLAVAWSNELIYWATIFLISFLFLKSGRWRTPAAKPAREKMVTVE